MMKQKRMNRELNGSIRLKNEGIALITSVGLVATMSTLGLMLMTTTLVEVRSAERFENRLTAFHWGEGAIDQTIVTLKANSSYTGVPSTAATNGRVTGSYQTTVTATGTANVYQIAAVGSAGTTQTYPGVQQRNITVIYDTSSQSPFSQALFAKQMIAMSGNARTNAYDSRNGPYNPATATAEGHVGTNAATGNAISLSGNVRINGDATVGPGANLATAIVMSGNAQITGTRSVASSAKVLDPVTLPSGVTSSGNLSISGNTTVTLPVGSYVYSSISISGNGRLNLGGATSIYVTGPVSISGNGVGTAGNLPPNLKLYVQGTRSVSISGNGNFYGAVYAPDSAISVSGNGEAFGSLVGKTFADSGNGNIHYDKALSQVSVGSSSGTGMKSWKES